MCQGFLSDQPVAYVLDADPAVYLALRGIARPRGVRVEPYASADEYFQLCDPTQSGCIFVDLDVPGSGGLGLLERLAREGVHLPVIVVSACGEVHAVVQGMRAGALNYLQKPCGEGQLAEALDEALRWNAENHQDTLDRLKVRRRLDRLNAGQRQVLDLLLRGLSNREIAHELKLSVRGVQARRSKVMGTMKATSLADLLRQAITGRPPVS
jgi:FixJ family two-component response regulator